MCFDNSRKQFLFSTSGALSNLNRISTVPGRCPVSQTVFIPALVEEKLFNFLKWWRHQWRHGYMAHNMHNYTFPPIYPQTIVCAVSFHLIQIVGIMPNKHTNTICEDITSLSRVIKKMNTEKHDQIWTHTPKYFKNVCSRSTFNMHVHVVSSPDWPDHRSCYLPICID